MRQFERRAPEGDLLPRPAAAIARIAPKGQPRQLQLTANLMLAPRFQRNAQKRKPLRKAEPLIRQRGLFFAAVVIFKDVFQARLRARFPLRDA